MTIRGMNKETTKDGIVLYTVTMDEESMADLATMIEQFRHDRNTTIFRYRMQPDDVKKARGT